MKKTLKTIIALCLTIAMLSSLFAGVTFAADTVAVEWYGFDALKATATFGEGTYASPAPAFFPATATETDVTWSVSDDSIATIDDDGVVTFLSAGTINVTAKLVDSSAVVESALKRNGASYELTITADLLKAVPAEASFASAGKGKEIVIIGAQGPLEIVSSSNELVATAEVLDENTIQINSKALGYADIKVTDGTSELVIPASVAPVDMATSQATWKQIFPDAETAATADPGYLQWWLECIPINVAASGINAGAGILGYGQPMQNTQNLTVSNSSATTLDGTNKTYFRYIGDGYNFYTMSTGKGMTVAAMYQFLNIRAPKAGTVNISPKVLSMTTNSTSDGSYIAVFVEDADGNLTRVFPAETSSDPKGTDAYAILNVTRNWLWVYPAETRFGKFNVGDNYQNWDSGTQTASDVINSYDSLPYTLTQAHVDLRKGFEANGATFTVEAGDIIRVAQHCGHEGNSDGMSFLPVFSYVEANVAGLLDSTTATEIVAGETADIRARLNPIGVEADITITPAYANGTVVTVDSYEYVPYSESNIDEYGYVDITLAADAASRAGTGYYRMSYGNYTQLIAVTVAASADGGEVEDDTPEAGVEVILGQGGSDDGDDDTGSGDDSGSGDDTGDGDDTPAFEFTFNTTPSGLTVSEPSTPNAFNGKFTWKYTNSNSSAQDYFLLMLYGTRDGSAIDLRSLPTVGMKEGSATASVSEFSDSYKGDFTPSASLFPKNGGTADLFWFYGDYDNLAKNGMTLIGQYLNFTR